MRFFQPRRVSICCFNKKFPESAALIVALVLLCSPCLFDDFAGATDRDDTFLALSHFQSRGSYGLDDVTRIDETTVTLNHFHGPWEWQLTVPYLRISSTSGLTMGPTGPVRTPAMTATMQQPSADDRMTPGSGMGQRPGMTTGSRTPPATEASSQLSEAGLGDISIKAAYNLTLFGSDGPVLAPGLILKLPTADDSRGLGTGVADLGFQLEVSKELGITKSFVTLGFTLTGDPDSIKYKDVLSLAVGAEFDISKNFRLGTTLDLRQKATDDADDLAEASLTAAWDLNPDWNLSFTATAGLTDAAPDWGAGLQIAMRY